MQPADMSNQILTVIDRAIAYTKDCMGATDAQLGNVKPDNTSAIMVYRAMRRFRWRTSGRGCMNGLRTLGRFCWI